MCSSCMHLRCPWVRMYPMVPVAHVDFPVVDDMVGEKVEKIVDLAPLSPAVEAQLEMHRKQGHFPHHRTLGTFLV